MKLVKIGAIFLLLGALAWVASGWDVGFGGNHQRFRIFITIAWLFQVGTWSCWGWAIIRWMEGKE